MNGGKQLEPEFVQYRAMRQEIAALRRQRAALYVTDTVRASASEHPYLAHTVAIAGKDQRLTRRIDARIERLRRRCEAVENTIVAEEDSRDRLVLRRYAIWRGRAGGKSASEWEQAKMPRVSAGTFLCVLSEIRERTRKFKIIFSMSIFRQFRF